MFQKQPHSLDAAVQNPIDLSNEFDLTNDFIDLNIDCKLLIFDYLPISDLVSLVSTNKFFSTLMRAVLTRRFSEKELIFETRYRVDEYIETSDRIHIRLESNAIWTLEQFGPYIQSIKLADLKVSEPKVYKLIDEYCSETLVHLNLDYLHENFFEFMKTPFKKVQTISLSGLIYTLASDELGFSDMFPALRYLRISGYTKLSTQFDLNALRLDFPLLEHLSVDIDKFPDVRSLATESMTMEIIENSPNIRILALTNASSKLLKFVAEKLPNLEKLEIYAYNEGIHRDNIHFEHVKIFRVGKSFHQSMPTHFTFSELEEFQVQPNPCDGKYIDFIIANGQLKKIEVFEEFGLTDDDLLRLSLAKLNVTEMKIVCDFNIQNDRIIQIVQNCEHLERFELRIPISAAKLETILIELKEEFDNDWNINQIDKVVVMEKKNKDEDKDE